MSKKTVMIVDDDKEFLQELQEMLALSGYAVISVHEPGRVVETANSRKPDVILLDLKMNSRNGFEIADELSRFAKTGDIPVIAMTGFFTENEHRSLMDICGIRTCLTKPFAATDIVRAIESA